MWICLNDAFFSIVASDRDPDLLNVRARRSGDIERHFPGSEVVELPNTDYAFRAFIQRRHVGRIIAQEAAAIGYTNFKESVVGDALQGVYGEVWAALRLLQQDISVDRQRPS